MWNLKMFTRRGAYQWFNTVCMTTRESNHNPESCHVALFYLQTCRSSGLHDCLGKQGCGFDSLSSVYILHVLPVVQTYRQVCNCVIVDGWWGEKRSPAFIWQQVGQILASDSAVLNQGGLVTSPAVAKWHPVCQEMMTPLRTQTLIRE